MLVDDKDRVWWKPIYEKGLKFLEEGNLKAAEEQFQLILNKNRKIPEAYIGLGLVFDKQNPGCFRAIEKLEKAVRLNPDNPDAWYHRAVKTTRKN